LSPSPENAVIAGGGIGGLATALALARCGIASQVCERRPEFPEEGAGIQIGPNGVVVLRHLGVADFLQDRVATPDVLSVRDGATARELTRLPLGTWIATRHGAPYWTAHRKDLHAALRQAAEREPLIALATNVEITSYEDDGHRVRAASRDGKTLEASLLVAADGLWSSLRAGISGDRAPKPAPLGKAAFRTVIDAGRLPTELTPNAVHIWLAPGAHVVHYPVNAGRNIAMVVIADSSTHESWDAPASSHTVREKIRNFAAPLHSLIEDAHDWRCWSLADAPRLERWTTGRAALLGDAAHAVPPFLAQGAVMALEDAVTLASELANTKNGIDASLRAYERVRRDRVARVAEVSRRNGRIYQMHGPAALARNTVMKLAPPSHVMSRFDWLYGWRPASC
jgi:salicylate hydroxylase